MLNAVKHFIVSEDGPTAVEYAVLVGLIIVALIATINQLETGIAGLFGKATDTLNNAAK